jgi:DNA-binding Lrp family transcriptional regulator
MKQLDVKDKKILTLLSINSRLKLHEIAQHVRLSKNSIKYRIERLQKLGYIKRFTPIISYDKIGYTTHDLFIKLRLRKEQEKELVEHFKDHPNVLWCSTLFGEWDLLIQFANKNFDEFYYENLIGVLKKFNEFIEDYEVKVTVKRFKLQYCVPDYFDLINKNKVKTLTPVKDRNIVQLDKVDRKLLSALSKNARANFQQLGKLINESLETTRNHFNKLIKEGVLEGFSVQFGYKELDLVNYMTFFRFRNISEEKEKEFKLYLQEKREVILALKNGNVPEIYLLLSANSPRTAETVIKDIKDKFFEQIKNITTITLTENIRLDFFPEGLIE